jgi:hypothetical protein
MTRIDQLIGKGESTMVMAEEDFAVSMKKIEKELLKEINKLFESIDVSAGKIQTSDKVIEFLASIEKRIDTALKKSGYNANVNSLLKNFEVIRQNNIDIHGALNNVAIPYKSLNGITKLEVENTIHKLLGSGISKDFKIPIREALYRNITLGATIQDAKLTIEDFILSSEDKPSRLLRYTTQVARDSLSQYDGAIQTTIKKELELNDYLYSGSIIRDSRCQCRYWVKKARLDAESLADEIDTALSGGSLDGCACSGMIPGTTVENFAVYRGGYSCRHRAISTNF